MKKKDNGLLRTKEQVHEQLGLLIERKLKLSSRLMFIIDSVAEGTTINGRDLLHEGEGVKIELGLINGAITALNWIIMAEDTFTPAEELIGKSDG